jgi:hypothetical protein
MDGRRYAASQLEKHSKNLNMEITRKDLFTGDINTHNLNITEKKITGKRKYLYSRCFSQSY